MQRQGSYKELLKIIPNYIATTLIQRVMRVYVFLLLVAFASHISASNYARVCYYTNWSQYRPGAGKFRPENIDPRLFTHLMYLSAKKKSDHQQTGHLRVEWRQVVPRENPDLKTLLAEGGWNHKNHKVLQQLRALT